jgi:hypothetical protein
MDDLFFVPEIVAIDGDGNRPVGSGCIDGHRHLFLWQNVERCAAGADSYSAVRYTQRGAADAVRRWRQRSQKQWLEFMA